MGTYFTSTLFPPALAPGVSQLTGGLNSGKAIFLQLSCQSDFLETLTLTAGKPCHAALSLTAVFPSFGSSILRHISTLLFAGLGRVVGLQILNNFLRLLLGNRCAEGLVHLVHLGFPGRGGKRWLHSDVARAVAGVAINLHVLQAMPG